MGNVVTIMSDISSKNSTMAAHGRSFCRHTRVCRGRRRGSFTAAAQVLGVTGSAVGKSISRLEARLGVQLLHRTTRRITSPAKGRVPEQLPRVLEELEQSVAYLATGHQQPVGRLRIDLPTTFGRRHILPPCWRWAGNFPAWTCRFPCATGPWTCSAKASTSRAHRRPGRPCGSGGAPPRRAAYGSAHRPSICSGAARPSRAPTWPVTIAWLAGAG